MGLIPLGILASLKKKFSFVTTGGGRVAYGTTFAALTNASWFIFGGSSTGTATTAYGYSTNATSWTNGTLPASKVWGKAATNGTRVVVIPAASDTAGAYTDNGTTWTSTTVLSTSARMRDIIWDGTRFLAISETSTEGLSHSTAGVTWTRIDTGLGGYCIGFDGLTTYIIGENASQSTARICTSAPTSAGNWSNITMPSAQRWISFVYGNGTWLALTDSTAAAVSTDGTTWTAVTLPVRASSAGEYDAKGYFYDGLFYLIRGAGSAISNTDIYTSFDGITWTLLQSSTLGTIRVVTSMIASGNTLLAVGYTATNDDASLNLLGTR